MYTHTYSRHKLRRVLSNHHIIYIYHIIVIYSAHARGGIDGCVRALGGCGHQSSTSSFRLNLKTIVLQEWI